MEDFVIRALIEALRDGELSATKKQGIITRIPKGDKDKNLIKKTETHFSSKRCIKHRILLHCKQNQNSFAIVDK